MEASEKALKQLLKKRLHAKRYEHSVLVMDTARKLAALHGADVQSAMRAGLLHDYAKNMSPEALRLAAQELSVDLDPVVSRHMMLAHGPVGAALIARDLGIADADILNAVRYHTYGRVGMSRLEKIIYLADFIEPGRKFKGIEELRRTAQTDLDKAVLMAMESAIGYLLGTDRLMHPNTLLARNELILELNSRRHHGINTGTGSQAGPAS